MDCSTSMPLPARSSMPSNPASMAFSAAWPNCFMVRLMSSGLASALVYCSCDSARMRGEDQGAERSAEPETETDTDAYFRCRV